MKDVLFCIIMVMKSSLSFGTNGKGLHFVDLREERRSSSLFGRRNDKMRWQEDEFVFVCLKGGTYPELCTEHFTRWDCEVWTWTWSSGGWVGVL